MNETQTEDIVEPVPPGVAERPDASPLERLVQARVRDGRVAESDLARTRRLAESSGEPLQRLLLRLGLVSERDLAGALSEVLDLPLAQSGDYPEDPVLEEGISLRFMKDARVVPVAEDEEHLVLALADPLEQFVPAAVSMAVQRPVTLRIGLPSEIEAAVEKLYGEGRSAMGGIVDGMQEGDDEADIEHLKDLASEAPVIRLVNLVIQRAVESRASDIHIEPFEDQLKVRYRIDGVLQEVEAPPARSTAAVISRVKIMAKLNIAERRLPQDGRIPLRVQGKEMDLRVSTVPTLYGESVVMRLLDKASVKFDFDALGFDGEPLQRFKRVLDLPHGIILVTGPTGSGKSTTLYTALSRINTPERKIITVEDPVEYQLAGINQIQVKSQIGMSFASALRAIVRQDPDVIMVGEMRDLETARIAVQSALTGHLVLSTLHTNNAAGGVTRLLDMGVEDYLMTSTVNGIVAQRLVRRLCQHCREPYTPLPEVAAELRPHGVAEEGELRLYHARGCGHCGGTGYLGRLLIAEVLLMSDALRQGILQHASASQLQRLAEEQGMKTMHQDGLRKALEGRTTLEEVIRVTQQD
jgi:general secretion pathway protein E